MQKTKNIFKVQSSNPLMFKRFSTKLALLIATALYVSIPVFASAQAAGNSQLTLSPSSGSYQVDSTLRVTINVISTDPMNGAQGVLNYDTSKLQYISLNTTGTAFAFACLASGGSGTVDIACTNLATLTGTRTLGVVNFKVLGGSGTTAITFNSTSDIRNNDSENLWNGNTSGGTYTLTSPATTPSTPPPAAPPTTTPSTPTTTTPAPRPKVVSTPTSSATNSQPTSDDPASETETQIGYFVAITVVDKDGNLVIDKEVTMAGKTVKTDSLGVASFTSVPAGSYEVTEGSDGNGAVLANITVEDKPDMALEIQKFEAQLMPENKWQTYVLPIIGVIGLLLVLFTLFKVLKKRHMQKRNHNLHFPTQSNSSTAAPVSSSIITPNQTTQTEQTPKPESDTPTQTVESKSSDTKKPIVWSSDDK